jgi:hypothetical protein
MSRPCGATTTDRQTCTHTIGRKGRCPVHGDRGRATAAPSAANGATVAAADPFPAQPEPRMDQPRLTIDQIDEAHAYVDDEGMPDYYAALRDRHWNPAAGAGSQFVSGQHDGPGSLMAVAHHQRGGLGGDDRDQLIALGAPPEAFMDGDNAPRYLLVRTPGVEGTVPVADLPDDTPVRAERTKPGTPCSLIVEGDADDRPPTGVATVIVGPHPKDPDREVMWTAHPGLPTRPAQDDRYDDGQQLTAGQVRADLGDDVRLLLRPTQSG